jgi:O-antigen ligase
MAQTMPPVEVNTYRLPIERSPLRGSLPALHWLVGIPLFISAFVALPKLLDLGPISGMGALTVAQVILLGLGILVSSSYPKRLLLRAVPYGCFIVWAAISPLWAAPSFQGVQNAIVYLLFGFALILAGTLAARNPSLMENLIGRAAGWVDCIALGLVLRDALANGLPNDPEEGWLVGPRPLAVLGLVMLSWHLSRWYFGSRRSRLLIALWLFAIVLSMSRAAIAVALLLIGVVVLLQMRFRPFRAAMSLPSLVVAASLTVSLVMYSTAFNDRFFAGASTQKVEVGGLLINTSGRINMWGATIRSAQESPIVGQGLGSSQRLIESMFANLGHPHNDYLRVWHDLGVVGVLFLIATMGSWLWILFRAWYEAEKRGSRAARLELAALLLLLALVLMMVPANALIYSTIMGPAGVLIGSGLGVRRDVQAPVGIGQ